MKDVNHQEDFGVDTEHEITEGTDEGLGDPSALDSFNKYRGLLFSIAYRMLGSVADAEDMLQETYIRWQPAASSEIESPRAFLVTIISRLCINHLNSARVRREEYFGEWLPEPLLTGSLNDPASHSHLDDSLSMAFLVLLERLNAVQRAVFLLREVFDYDYPEIAQAVGLSETNCRQILRRARQHVADLRPRFDTSPEQREQLLQQFLAATAHGDLSELVAMLSNDVVLHADGGGKGPAVPNLVYGAGQVARALLGGLKKFVPKNIVQRKVQINGELGVVSYLEGRPFSVFTLDIAVGLVQSIYIITNPEKLAGLPGLEGEMGL